MYSYELLYGTLGNLVISQTLFCASIVTFILKYLVVSDICVNTLSLEQTNSKILLRASIYNYFAYNEHDTCISSEIFHFLLYRFYPAKHLWHSTERTSWQHG